MKRTTLISIAASLAAMMSLATSAQSLVVTVTNKSQNQRQELVSVDTKTVKRKARLEKWRHFYREKCTRTTSNISSYL